jgi:hypothetical protein
MHPLIYFSLNLHLILFPQINLVVGDYFKRGCAMLHETDQAEELITWMRSKTMFLGLLNEEQTKQNKTPTTIIRPVLTRWTAHLRAYERILQSENAIMSVISTELGRPEEHRKFITGDRKSKEKAHRMVQLIRNSLFWHNLARYVNTFSD